jgi:arylsulfatase A-like enzyme
MYGPRARLNRSLDCEDARLPACLPESRIVREDLCNYLFEVQRFDRDLGNVLAELESIGELHNTIVIVTSDNGMPFPRCKANLYDTGTHVPLVMRWGSRWGQGRRIDEFVSLCDIAPTLLDVLGMPAPEEMSGRSLLPLLQPPGPDTAPAWRDHVITGRERHICAQGNTLKGYPSRAIRTSDFLYIRNFESQRWPVGTPPAYRDVDRSPTRRYMLHHRDEPGVKELFKLAFGKRPPEELYDLRSDPGQLVNVAEVPDYADMKERLAGRLMKRLKRTGDPRAFGNGEVFDTYAYYMIKRIHQ